LRLGTRHQRTIEECTPVQQTREGVGRRVSYQFMLDRRHSIRNSQAGVQLLGNWGLMDEVISSVIEGLDDQTSGALAQQPSSHSAQVLTLAKVVLRCRQRRGRVSTGLNKATPKRLPRKIAFPLKSTRRCKMGCTTRAAAAAVRNIWTGGTFVDFQRHPSKSSS
jgi:hypothetical protein